MYDNLFNIKNGLIIKIPEIKNSYVSFSCNGILLSDFKKTLKDYDIISGDKIIILDKDELKNQDYKKIKKMAMLFR